MRISLVLLATLAHVASPFLASARGQCFESLTLPDPASDDLLGASLATDGQVLFIGAPGRDGAAPHCGVVFLYSRVMEEWVQVGSFSPSDLETDDNFGRSVLYQNDRLLVSAPRSDATG